MGSSGAALPSFRNLAGVAASLGSVGLLTLMITRIELLIAGWFLPPEELAVYGVATRLAGLVIVGLPAVATVAAARLSELLIANDRQQLAQAFRRYQLTSLSVAAVPALVLLVVPEWILGLFGPGYEEGARVLGIDTDRVYATTFALNCAICGAAGGLVAMTWFVQPYLGLTYTLRSFMIVVAAGLGNLPGVIVAGSGLGVLEEFAGFVLGAEYQTAFIFLLLIALLIGRNLVLARQRKYLQ